MSPPDKSDLRKTSLALRGAIGPSEHARFSAACCHGISTYIEALEGTPVIIAGYSAINSEVDIGHALELLAERHTLALPVADKAHKLLTFRRYHRGDSLTRGAFGVMEPPADAELVAPDVLLVPLLAFDRSGHRLGYGAGYYDATLARLRGAKPVTAIGVAFAQQEVEAIPAEAFDQRLDMVVTEKETIKVT